MTTKAYSYIRFSNIKQEQGDSIARQVASRDAWIARQKDVELDAELDLVDAGVTSSARGRGKRNIDEKLYKKGTNLDPEKGKLGQFIQKCEEGKIPKGSYLILDSMDRFSRDTTLDVAYLLKKLVTRYGLKIVILKPSEMILDEKNVHDTQQVLMLVLTISMSFEYAERLSDNIRGAWKRKRKSVREGKAILDHAYPSWLEITDEKTFKIKEKAKEAIKFLYARIIEGTAQYQIVKLLNEKYQPITTAKKGKRNHWNTSYVSRLSKDRRLLGELQLQTLDHNNELVNDGPPLQNYFPQVIDEDTFYAAQTAKKTLRLIGSKNKGRIVNLFTGLVYNAEDNHSMFVQEGYNVHKGKRYEYSRMISYGRKTQKDYCKITLNYLAFERLMIDLLTELASASIEKPKTKTERISFLRNIARGQEEKLDQIAKALHNDKNTEDIQYLLDIKRKTATALVETNKEILLLEQTNEIDKGDISKQLKGLKRRLVSDKNRQNTKQLISRIVYRIIVLPLKLKNRRSICAGIMILRNGEYRYFVLSEGFFPNTVISYDDNRRRYFLYTKHGVVKYPSKKYPKNDIGRKAGRYKQFPPIVTGSEFVENRKRWWSAIETAKSADGRTPLKGGFDIEDLVSSEYFQKEFGKDNLWDLLDDLTKRNKNG